MRNKDVLTVEEIKEIKDLKKLNTLIAQYEKELNRRMQLLQKYQRTDPSLYRKGMQVFAGLSQTPGFQNVEISSPETTNIIVARARLINLSNALRQGNTQIRTLRKNARMARIKQERQLYNTLNKDKKRVTHKQLQELTSADWAKIRELLDKYNYIDSDTVIEIYLQSSEETEDVLISRIMDVINKRQAAISPDSDYKFDW